MGRSPYSLRSNECKNKKVHKDLIKAIQSYQKKLQKDCDMKYGKGKYKVPESYASKILGGVLK